MAVHTIAKTVRSCYLLGDDQLTGKNFDHRKQWFEGKLKQLAAKFGIDLLAFACLANHLHLVLRSRPDVVATWDDTEVARRWWALCPKRKVKHEIDGQSIWLAADASDLRFEELPTYDLDLTPPKTLTRGQFIETKARYLCQGSVHRSFADCGLGISHLAVATY